MAIRIKSNKKEAVREVKVWVGDRAYWGRGRVPYELEDRPMVFLNENGVSRYVCWDELDRGRVIFAARNFIRGEALTEEELHEVKVQIKIHEQLQ